MKRFLTLIILCVSTCAVFAQTNTWTGTTNDHWETGTNWSLGVAPTPCHDIVIPVISGKPSPKLYTNISISNITFSGGNLSTNNFNITYISAGPECGASASCGCTDCDLAAIKDVSNPSVGESATGTPTANYVIENTHLTSDGTSVAQSITYLDGLGRPMQKVSRGAGGFLLSNPDVVTDLVQPIEYDAYGRETKKYLAYAASESNGGLIESAVTDQATYLSGLGKGGNAFTEIVYENSPLNRILSQKAPGSGTAQTFVYRGNTSGDNIKQLTYNFSTSKIDIATYGAGKLFVTEVTDERNNKTTEYKDLQDRVVCRDVAGKKTYYCFDDFGLLRCVVPPAASSVLGGSNFDPASGELLFVYGYDSRGRMTSKRIPSAGTTSMTYDVRDRVDVTTDAKNQELKNIYDDLNRITSVTLGGTEITRNYYDAYPPATGGISEGFDQTHAYGVANLTSLRGMLTATDQQNLGSTMLRTVTYYDNTGQVIQKASQNHKSGWDRQSSKLDFAGRTLETKLSTRNALVVETRTSYDRGGRTKAICQKVSDGSTDTTSAYWEPVGRYSYNGIGEMVSKTLGCNIQKVDYAYNMRGWMTSLNNPNQLSTASEKDFFGMTLDYDGVGNITTWNYRVAQRTGTYGAAPAITPKDPYAYTFTYDELNRIKTAGLNKMTTPAVTVFALGGNDGGKMKYDDNGNILSMQRTFNGAVVDNLAYAPAANSNEIASISESGTNPSTANEFFAASSSYTYDANGNLLTDTGKGITNIVYNYLNLPQTITKSGQTISYNYTADGTKLKANFGTNKVYDYVAGLVYRNDSLEFIPTAEGRILPPGRAINPQLNGSTAAPAGVANTFYRYEYQINDHLGNLRVACRCGEKAGAAKPGDAYGPIVVQENHYDPWGLGLPLNADAEKVGGSPEDRFTFQGQEKQKDLGWFQFKWRMSDPQTGRFISVDPLSEKYVHNSTYAFSENKVTAHIELEGLESVSATVLGKAQNTYNGLTKRADQITNVVSNYGMAMKSSLNNWKESIEKGGGYAFTSESGGGEGTRKGDGKSGSSIDIDGILSAFGAAGADGGAFKLDGKGVIGKVISALGFMKESASAGDMVGEAFNAVVGDSNTSSGNGNSNKISRQDIISKQNKNVPGMKYGSTEVNQDSSTAIFKSYDEKKELIKVDTLKAEKK
jgi:RHS repeat-associated protein